MAIVDLYKGLSAKYASIKKRSIHQNTHTHKQTKLVVRTANIA